ncbi:MAG: hypothetical protein NWR72_09685 [Bacteroidia bacterium]|nr:hypothetical protein [Bacteroidia bacterium]
MKPTLILALISASILFTACNGDEIDRLEKQNNMLLQAQASQDSILSGYMSAFNTFDENLSAIKQRENIISNESLDPEFQSNPKDKVLEDIALINDLLTQNKSIIEDLNNRLDRTEGDQTQLRRLITRMEAQLKEKDQEIVVLKEQLVEMNFTSESLSRRLDTMAQAKEQLVYLTSNQKMRMSAQDSTIADQQGLIGLQVSALNTGYYVVGNAKDLKEQNVITTEGGFIGIGADKVLRTDFNHEAFTKVDITATDEITFDNKKVRLVTNHPSDAYVLNESDNKITSLEITDAKRFWSVSKYLVVVTD